MCVQIHLKSPSRSTLIVTIVCMISVSLSLSYIPSTLTIPTLFSYYFFPNGPVYLNNLML